MAFQCYQYYTITWISMEYIKHLGIVLPEKKTFFKNSIKCTSSEDCYGLNEKVIASVVSKSRKGYSYNLSPANRISFMLFTFHMLVQILFCTAFTKNTKQHGRHWCPLESGLNISSLWWILPCNNTDAFSCRFIWFDGPGFCSVSIFSHLLTTSGFIQY